MFIAHAFLVSQTLWNCVAEKWCKFQTFNMTVTSIYLLLAEVPNVKFHLMWTHFADGGNMYQNFKVLYKTTTLKWAVRHQWIGSYKSPQIWFALMLTRFEQNSSRGFKKEPWSFFVCLLTLGCKDQSRIFHICGEFDDKLFKDGGRSRKMVISDTTEHDIQKYLWLRWHLIPVFVIAPHYYYHHHS